MRLVLDTNVVLSSLLWRGTPHRLLVAVAERPHIHLTTSTALLEELADVLSRPVAAKRLGAIGRTARDVVTDYVRAVDVVEPAAVPRVVIDDPDDDQVIAVAIASRAAMIVSGDTHLLAIGHIGGIDIVTAAVAIARIT